MNAEDALTYCGGSCATCARFAGFTAFRQAASLLLELSDAHGFQYWMPHEVRGFDYAQFREGLAFFGDPDSWLVCPEGCRGGGGGPPDCPRSCCIDHSVDICFDCPDLPCDRNQWSAKVLERAAEYQGLGRGEWLRRLADLGVQGYEAHTGKYYSVSVASSPPEVSA
jgi:hypothetical protein